MKRLLSLAVLTMALIPLTPSMADSVQNNSTTVGNGAYTGAFTASNLNPIIPNFSFVYQPGPPIPWQTVNQYIQTNSSLQGVLVNPGVTSTGNAFTQIYGFSISCVAYNPTTAALSPGSYPYTTETTGIAGGSIFFQEFKPTGSIVTIGTLTLPNSPHGGPYVSNASVMLATPYTPTYGSTITFGLDTNPAATQYYSDCSVSFILQNPNTKGANGS